jgi:hypothetical protein
MKLLKFLRMRIQTLAVMLNQNALLAMQPSLFVMVKHYTGTNIKLKI